MLCLCIAENFLCGGRGMTAAVKPVWALFTPLLRRKMVEPSRKVMEVGQIQGKSAVCAQFNPIVQALTKAIARRSLQLLHSLNPSLEDVSEIANAVAHKLSDRIPRHATRQYIVVSSDVHRPGPKKVAALRVRHLVE